MEMLLHFLLALLGSISLIILVHAQDPSGFINIDCGLPDNSSYTDATTGLKYISDESFIDTGISKSLSPLYSSSSLQQQLWYLRSFPQGIRNCYNINLTGGNKYLIRATFLYGNYDGLGKVPEFDLQLGANMWDSVKLNNESTIITKEIIHVPSSNYIYVCLVDTNLGTPFISALELRPLKNSIYQTQFASLLLFVRLDVGSITNKTVRYQDDVYDRIWTPFNYYEWDKLNTSLAINSQSYSDYQPPSIVMDTASTPANASQPLNFYLDTADPISQYYVYMHFAELVELQANQSREFEIYLNDQLWTGPVVPEYLHTTTLYNISASSTGKYQFSINKTSNSTLPPILNAIEVYVVKELSQSQTNQTDVDAIMNIKSMYGITRNWQGDPCAPQAYLWDGLNCSYNGHDLPRIISLNLSSSGLSREIAPYISNLTMIQYLDLSYNSLTGSVPDFLARLPNLRVLNLTGNQLTGSVPLELIKKWKNGSLSLSACGNPNLDSMVSCEKKKNNKKYVVPIVASVAVLLVLLTAVAILCILKRRKQQAGKVDARPRTTYESLESKSRQFTYSEVLRITNNFERVLGKGGFGTVYHGYLDGTPVAVKMLSLSSVQGYKQFQAEVKLLMRVHHRNLTTLVGYCDEDTKVGLVYEYMANGNLEEHLSGTSAHILNWEGRLRVALEAAQGLEYLHNGCKPPIVHRDVKSTNILLNDKFQAKLGDFGLSRTFPAEGDTHVLTVVAGTPGYLDPEYYGSNRLTEKSDVFSFGVVLLEIITSRPVIARTKENTHISQWVSSMLKEGDIKGIVDPRLQGDFDINSTWKAVEIAMTCVSPSSFRRPTMNHVMMELNECLAAEIARTNEGHEAESKDSIEMFTVSMQTEFTPLAR